MTPATQPEPRTDTEQAGVRDLVAAYPWLPVVLGLLVSALGVWCFSGLAEQVHQGGPLLRLDEHLLRVSLELRSAPLIAALSVLTWLGDVLAGWSLGASWSTLLLSLWLFAEQLPRLINTLVARKSAPASGPPQASE